MFLWLYADSRGTPNPAQMANFTTPYLGLSTFLRPDIEVSADGMIPLEVLPLESAQTHFGTSNHNHCHRSVRHNTDCHAIWTYA